MTEENDEYDEEYNEYKRSHTISGADKVNWAITIQRQMEKCLKSKGKKQYKFEVLSLVDAVDTDFYGLNIADGLKDKKILIKKETQEKIKEELGKLYYKPETLKDANIVDKIKIDMIAEEYYYHRLFQCVRDIWGKKRGLLFGSKRLESGHEMAD